MLAVLSCNVRERDLPGIIPELKKTGQKFALFGYSESFPDALIQASFTHPSVVRSYLSKRGQTWVDTITLDGYGNLKRVSFIRPDKSNPPYRLSDSSGSGASCMPCEDSVKSGYTNDESIQKDLRECNVLSMFQQAFPSWLDCRGVRFGAFLEKHGIRHDYYFTNQHNEVPATREAIKKSGCSVVLIDLAIMLPVSLEKLANEFPEVTFIPIIHCSPNYHHGGKAWFNRTISQQAISVRCENVKFGTVMDKDRYDDFHGADVISLPNFFDIPELDHAVKDADAPHVFSMVGRNDNVKGVPASISILARLREEMELQCIGISTQFPSDHRAKLAQAHIPSSLIPWTTWQKSLEIIASYVDVGLQLSQSESFNLVSIEHMALGKPMIATPAIEYIPQEWQINPQNPREGVGVAKRILENYEEESEKARIVALAVGTRCNEILLENLTPLIKR